MSEKYQPQRAYPASPRRAFEESPRRAEADTADYVAQRMETTKRGTEIAPSTTGDRIIDAAHRVAGFFDRLKLGYNNGMETAEAARNFVGDVADTAITGAIERGAVLAGATLLAGEKAAQLPGKALKAADRALDAFSDATLDGMESAGKWIGEKMESASEWVDEKGTALNERANAGLEKIRAKLQDRAEQAKLRREARRARRGALINAINIGMEATSVHWHVLRDFGKTAVKSYRQAVAAERARLTPDAEEADVAIA